MTKSPQDQLTHHRAVFNRTFPSCLLPLNQNESTCETIHIKMHSLYRLIIKVLNEDLF